MATAPSYMTAGSDFDLAQQQALRQHKLADMLRQQSMEPLQGHMAGQYYAAPSWTQGLAKMMQGYVAGKQGDMADENLKTARSNYDQRTSQESDAFIKALRGAPGQDATPEAQGNNPSAYQPGQAATPATAPDMNAAMGMAFKSQNPMIQGMGSNILGKQVDSEMTQQMLAKALAQFGVGGQGGGQPAQPGQAPTGAPGAMPGAPQAPQGGGLAAGMPGVSPLAAALTMSGNPTLGNLGKMAQEGFAEGNKPVINRGFGLGRMVNGQYVPDQASLDQALAMERGKQGITAPMETPVTIDLSGGQKAQLSRPEYKAFQESGNLPARYQQAAPPNAPSAGYAGGSAQAAAGGQLEILQAELNNPKYAGDKPAIQREIDRLTGGQKGGLGTPGLTQSQPDVINQERQRAGGKAVDESFAKDYVTFTTGGGAADATKQLGQLNDVVQALKDPKANLTGPYLGTAPDFVKKFTNPQSIAMRERVEEVVQRSLRAILGAQFTEKEGERLIARAYNPNQPEAENATRVNRLYQQLSEAFKSKQDASQYFQTNGTLEGWKGKLYNVHDFDAEPMNSMKGSIGNIHDQADAILNRK